MKIYLNLLSTLLISSVYTTIPVIMLFSQRFLSYTHRNNNNGHNG